MESTEKARVALIAPLVILTPLSFSSNFPRAQYLDIRSLTHELIVKGWVDLLSYGAPQARASCARRASLRTELIYTFRDDLNFGEGILNIGISNI